jgi:hypothetical protein
MDVYFILPVGSDRAYPRKREIIDRVLDRTSLTGHFPLDVPFASHESSLDATLAQLRASRRVIADLANGRPSCYFETGLAQASGADVHLIAPRGTQIHQVANRAGVTFYADDKEYESLLMHLLSTLKTQDEPSV